MPVGVVSRLDVTEDEKAALVLRIDDEDFTPWKADAECTIRPQSLIGEKFVECEPGSASAEPLEQIEDGPGRGRAAAAARAHSSPVDLDLINNVLRLPYRQRFSILLSELGAGLAGRGEELNEVIHRANPALRETDKVLAILAGQNRVLADLARDSDAALGPLAREREKVADWIVQANARGRGLRRAARRHPPRHQPPARLPARAAAADGRPREGGRPGHAAAARPRRGGARRWTA